MFHAIRRIVLCATLLGLASPASEAAPTAPYMETFATGAANWTDGSFAPLSHVSSGGPGGGEYATADFSFSSATGSIVMFRGQASAGASGGAFTGDWLAGDIRQLTAYVRHDAPEPIRFFARLATPLNFPGVNVQLPDLVAPGAWTLLEFDLAASNPLVVPEGPPSTYTAAFSNIGNVQIGIAVPETLATDATMYQFDLAQVSIAVPEPSALALCVAGITCGVAVRRRPRSTRSQQ